MLWNDTTIAIAKFTYHYIYFRHSATSTINNKEWIFNSLLQAVATASWPVIVVCRVKNDLKPAVIGLPHTFPPKPYLFLFFFQQKSLFILFLCNSLFPEYSRYAVSFWIQGQWWRKFFGHKKWHYRVQNDMSNE